ncbi:hypothetical protein BC628DRAFT_1331992 [Trametes gibbosa]|nr:hypothetical protein BC628DRAFT_1331992 [Trametes gibbosa]
MLPQFLAAPLTAIRAAFSRPAPPQSPSTGRSPPRARPISTASSVTLAPAPPTPPPAAATQPSELLALEHQSDLIGSFWGGGAHGGLRLPAAAKTSKSARGRAPPPPQEEEEGRRPRGGETSVESFAFEMAAAKHAQARTQEPRTLARKLFWFGFLFPLLWTVGAVFVFSPTKYAVDLERGSVADAQDMVRHKKAYRAAEDKWARRCLVGCMSFWGAVIVVVTTVVLAEKGM